MLILPKEIYRVNTITIRNLVAFFAKKKKNPKIHLESQGNCTSKIFLKKNRVRSLTLPTFKASLVAPKEEFFPNIKKNIFSKIASLKLGNNMRPLSKIT